MKKIFLFIIIFTSISFAQTVVDSYSESNYSADIFEFDALTPMAGQAFTGNGLPLSGAKFYLKKNGTPAGNVYAKLYASTGTYGSTCKPTGDVLATSDAIVANSLSTSMELISFTFSTPYTLVNGTKYIIVANAPNSLGNATVIIGADNTSPSHAGNASYISSTTWYALADWDLCFYVYGISPTTFIPIITFIE